MTRFVKRYPRAVVRIERPRPGRPTWGPMWRAWMIGPDGNIIRDAFGLPEQVSFSPWQAAFDDARLAVGITRRVHGVVLAGAGDLR